MTSLQDNESTTNKPQFFYGYIIVAAAFVIEILIWGTFQTFGVFFKSILSEFGWTRALTAGAFSLCMVFSGLLGIVTGRLTDKFGPRIVITVCGAFLGLGYLLMSQIGAPWHFYLFYGIIIGLGMSSAWIPLLSTVARWFVKRRSIMSGIILTGMGIGQWIAPLIADHINNTYGWRVSYLILGITTLVIIIAAAQFLKRDPAESGLKAYGSSRSEEHKVYGGLSLIKSMGTIQFWILVGILTCFGFVLLTYTVHIVSHSIDLGLSSTNAAVILSTMGGASILGMIALGNLGDRIGNRKAMTVCFTIMTAAMFWLIPADEAWELYLFAFAFGFAQGGTAVQESPLMASLFGLKAHGVIFGVIGVGFTAGSALGPFISGYIFDVYNSYQPAFIICAAMGLIAFVLTFFLRPAMNPSDR